LFLGEVSRWSSVFITSDPNAIMIAQKK
jgi:hypothetical protein